MITMKTVLSRKFIIYLVVLVVASSCSAFILNTGDELHDINWDCSANIIDHEIVRKISRIDDVVPGCFAYAALSERPYTVVIARFIPGGSHGFPTVIYKKDGENLYSIYSVIAHDIRYGSIYHNGMRNIYIPDGNGVWHRKRWNGLTWIAAE